MNAFMDWMEKHFMPIAAKIGSQRHLVAVRDGFISIMPVTMVGSLAVLLNVFLRDLPNTWWGEGNEFVANVQQIINVNGNVYFGSIVILGLCFTFSLGYHLGILCSPLWHKYTYIGWLRMLRENYLHVRAGLLPDTIARLFDSWMRRRRL